MNPLLLPLSAGYRLGTGLRHAGYRSGMFKTRRLPRPVVSVGNLTVGGTGKTPLVAYVATLLLRQGWKPSILTRGYGRDSKVEMIVLPPGVGRRLDAEEIGDEPAILARALPEIPLVVCADRFRGGQAAEEQFRVDVHILDDGFQHLALARAVDLVALDATQKISNWELLPAGRQRETLEGLRRAQMVVLTRTDSADPQALEGLVRKIHPAAKVFRGTTEVLGWKNALEGGAVATEDVRAKKAAAFCGIGNPQAFFADLRRWGFTLAEENAFPDHHVYTGEDIRRLVAKAEKAGATVLLTTQKDAVKFSVDWRPALPILACEIAAQIQDAGEFEKALLSLLPKASS